MTKPMKSKGLLNQYELFSDRIRKNRFVFSVSKHSTTKREETEILKNQNIAMKVTGEVFNNITSTATNIFSTGMNLLLPNNLFWDTLFCVMATSKSYVDIFYLKADDAASSD